MMWGVVILSILHVSVDKTIHKWMISKALDVAFTVMTIFTAYYFFQISKSVLGVLISMREEGADVSRYINVRLFAPLTHSQNS